MKHPEIGTKYRCISDNAVLECVYVGKTFALLSNEFDERAPQLAYFDRCYVQHVEKEVRSVHIYMVREKEDEQRGERKVFVSYWCESMLHPVEEWEAHVKKYYDIIGVRKITITEGDGMR